MAFIRGTNRNDRLNGTEQADTIDGENGDDVINAGGGDDVITGGKGDDTINGGAGNDTALFDAQKDGADKVNLGAGDDTVVVSGKGEQIRLTFTSAEVGNGSANDSNTLANQDGGLAVRLQAEGNGDKLKGPVSRFDDEGITFVGQGVTFDVRDLVSGVQRGDQFDVVFLGAQGADVRDFTGQSRAYYLNGGQGDDLLTGGSANDFLVGGAGADTLNGGLGNDSFIGGGGNDTVFGGAGDDLSLFNVSTEGSDKVNLGTGDDTVGVSAAAPTQVRLTFTSAEVGNGNPNDSGTMANQDGGLAVRLQAEDGSGALVGPVSRFDDEGITFESRTPGLTFDVRDLVSGVARGDQFQVVTLGTQAGDVQDETGETRSYYINGGQGNDVLTGGEADDFLVGGAGADTLSGGGGNDKFIGGGGNDTLTGGEGPDEFIFTPGFGQDRITDYDEDEDTLNFTALTNAGQTSTTTETPEGTRITFTDGSSVLLEGYFEDDGGSQAAAFVDEGRHDQAYNDYWVS